MLTDNERFIQITVRAIIQACEEHERLVRKQLRELTLEEASLRGTQRATVVSNCSTLRRFGEIPEDCFKPFKKES